MQMLKQKSPNRREAETCAPNKGMGINRATTVTKASIRSPRERTV